MSTTNTTTHINDNTYPHPHPDPVASPQPAVATTLPKEKKSNHNSNNMTTEVVQQRLEKSRERNRLHARRTRMRKKQQLSQLQSRCRRLEAQKTSLQQAWEERRVAGILLGLGHANSNCGGGGGAFVRDNPHQQQQALPPTTTDDDEWLWPTTTTTSSTTPPSKHKKQQQPPKRKRSAAAWTVVLDGLPVTVGKQSHVNWKTGHYCDPHGIQRKLSPDQLESLRRERNRLHAKMTRDRKKCFLATLEKHIDDLEQDIQALKDRLGGNSSAVVSPELLSSTPGRAVEHGFSLNDS